MGDSNYKCIHDNCDYSSVNYNRLLSHIWEKHGIHSSFKHPCNISSCTRKFSNLQSFRRHLKLRHAWFYDLHVRRYNNQEDALLNNAVHLGEGIPNEGQEQEELNIPGNTVNENVFAAEIPQLPHMEDEPVPQTFSVDECDDIVSEFLLQLRETYNVTQGAVSFVSEQVSKILNSDRSNILNRVRDSISRNHGDILDYETDSLIKSSSLFSKSFERFRGSKKLDNYVISNDYFVAPVEVDLGVNPVTSKQESFQYIPLLKTLEMVLKHDDILNVLENPPAPTFSEEGEKFLQSFQDGTSFKENLLFQEHPSSLQIVLYHDDFNVVNPLGNKTEKYKISAFYFVLGNVSAKHQARLSDIHLLLLTHSSFIAKYGYESVLQPFIEDMRKLETEGISFLHDGNAHHFYGSLTMVIADNLAAHALGGYFCNFSTVDRICRFCNCRRCQLQEGLPIKHFRLRSAQGYNNNLASIEANPGYCSLYGIREKCCLNELHYFHVISGLPPDIAHDVFEGFAVDILYHLICHCITKKYFDINDLREIMSSFPYSNADRRNKPQPFKGVSMSSLKVKATACEMWTLLRLFPLMVGELLPEDDNCWSFFLDFLDIIERLCSLRFTNGDLLMLQSLLDSFMSNCNKIFSDIKMKPKSHYLQHYPQMIRIFGPLIKTLRFESKHSYFKSLTKTTKNRVNLCLTLAKRHQMNMSLHYKKENILAHNDPSGTYIKEVSLEEVEAPLQEAVQDFFYLQPSDLLSTSRSVVYEGVKYYAEEVVVVDHLSDEPIFGFVKSIWYYQKEIFLLCDILTVDKYNCHFHSYEVSFSENTRFIKIAELYDYHPLSLYKINNINFVPLHHFISF